MKKSEIQIAVQARGARYIRPDDVSDKCAVVTFLCILNVVVLSQLERMQQSRGTQSRGVLHRGMLSTTWRKAVTAA